MASFVKRRQSWASLLGAPEPSPHWQPPEYLPLDKRARDFYLDLTEAPAWEWICLHSHLDPQPLRFHCQSLCEFGEVVPDFAGKQLHVSGLAALPAPSQCLQFTGLILNLRIVHDAIEMGELPTLRKAGRKSAQDQSLPLLRSVRRHDFIALVEARGLSRTLPWPDLSKRHVVGDGHDHFVKIPLSNDIARGIELVWLRFGDFYKLGGDFVPRDDEIRKLLETEFEGRMSGKSILAVAAALKPSDTPKGLRTGATGRPPRRSKKQFS